MNLNSLGLVKNYTCSAAINPYRIVAINGDTEKVAHAVDGQSAVVGVSGVVGTVAAEERLDIYKDGVRTVEFGGVVKAGEPVVADAQGRAIKAVPGAGQTIRIAGFAEETGDVGVRGQIHIAPQYMRG